MRPSFVSGIYCSTKDAALNTTVHPTQRRLLIALVVTLACLPLLVLDMVQGSSSSSASEWASSSSDSSLVVSAVPSTEATTTTSVAVTVPAAVATSAPTTTAAPAAKVAPRAVAPTTTTTAPRPVVTAAPVVQSEAAFLACVRERESHGNYSASDPSGTYLGAYQIYQGGWDSVASRIGRTDLIGVPPNQASPADQDTVAAAMFRLSGRAPWGGICG
ncbi:MAG: transglycosylase family protein [Actinobacteria bacterium]|nr:transglycosylase family protein [Actinomycetota bacterium]